MVWQPSNHVMACMHHVSDGISFKLRPSLAFYTNATVGNEIVAKKKFVPHFFDLIPILLN